MRAEVALLVRRYLAATGRTLSSEGPLLLSQDPAKRRADRRLSTRAVGYLIDRLCERAAIDANSSLSTTSRYLDHLELGELRQAVPELPASQASE